MTLRAVKSYIILQISFIIRSFPGKGVGVITASEDLNIVRANLNSAKKNNLLVGIAGIFAVLLPVEISSATTILEIFLGAVFIMLLYLRFRSDPSGRSGAMRVIFVFSGILILITAFGADRELISISFAVFLFAELSSRVTEFIGEGPVTELDGRNHSIPGTAVFFFLAFLVTFGFCLIIVPASHLLSLAFFYNLSCAFIISVIVTLLKVSASNDIEYLLAPLLIFVLLFSFMDMRNIPLAGSFYTGFLLAFAVSYSAYRLKLTTAGGSMSVFLLAAVIFGFGGWQWTVPILTFFVLSSFLSKISRRVHGRVDTGGKGDVRDGIQVMANGGIAAMIIIINQLFPSELLYAVYVSSVAAVCADTWGTEIGMMINSSTVDILTLRKVVPGLSGGISLPGIFGGILGAFIIAVSSLSWIHFNDLYFIIFISGAGLLGSITDSVLGSSVQAKYKCSRCGAVTEGNLHCGEKAEHIKGIEWIGNDLINAAASLSGGIFLLIFYSYSTGIR